MSTQIVAGSLLTSFKIDPTPIRKYYGAVHSSSNFGPTRTCRYCGNKLRRKEFYLHMDYPGFKGHKETRTFCQTCVEEFAVKIKEANDLLRNNSSEF